MRTSEFIKVNGVQVPVLERHSENSDDITEKRQVFIIGSKGIPAAYGGFETFVDKLTEYQMSDRIRYHVACLGKSDVQFEYHGAKCFMINVPEMGAAKAVYYDVAALKHCIEYCRQRPGIKNPIFYVLACRIGPFIGKLKKEIEQLGGSLYVNPDGHEWMRGKWSFPVKKYWKLSEKLMVKYADLLICDSVNIERYIQKEYRKYRPSTTYIAYGSDSEMSASQEKDREYQDWIRRKGLTEKNYYLMVGRFVPENNFECIIREFMSSNTEKDLAIITTDDEKFLRQLERRLHFRQDSRIRFVGTVYDQKLLKKIRENAYGYFHGHEVGGTNPSLLEALGTTELNLLLDVGFNKEVAGDAAIYWNKEEGNLAALIDEAEILGEEKIKFLGKKAKKRIKDAYSWKYIVERYEELFIDCNRK